MVDNDQSIDVKADALLNPAKPDDKATFEKASAADDDLEVVLSELERIQGERGRWTSKKGDMYLEYERLRQRATEMLGDDGPRYFLDLDGSKMVATKSQAEPVDIDPEILDHLPADVVDYVAPRKIDKEKFKRAMAQRRVPAKLFVRFASVKQNAPFVRFIRASDFGD